MLLINPREAVSTDSVAILLQNKSASTTLLTQTEAHHEAWAREWNRP